LRARPGTRDVTHGRRLRRPRARPEARPCTSHHLRPLPKTHARTHTHTCAVEHLAYAAARSGKSGRVAAGPLTTSIIHDAALLTPWRQLGRGVVRAAATTCV
jgi:hypothetical protein